MGGTVVGGERISYEDAKHIFFEVVSPLPFATRPVGSFVRQSPTIGDLDFVVVDTPEARSILTESPFFVKHGPLAIIWDYKGTQVDFFLVPRMGFFAAAVWYTSTPAIQCMLRTLAKLRGFTFGPKGLHENGRLLEAHCIDDVYKYLCIDPIPVSQMEELKGYEPWKKFRQY